VLAPELLARIRRLELKAGHLASEILLGEYKSAFKGRGWEFDEVREYQIGDEIRSIDWNVTARMGQPFVKLFREEREMTLMLLAAMPVDFTTELKLFTFVNMVHNLFCATQDVAIDALACNVLPEHERGLANGLMFGGAYLGQAIGGAGVLFLIPYTGIPATFVFVAAVLLSVTVFVALPMKEPRGPPRPAVEGSKLKSVRNDLVRFVRDVYRAFAGSRAAWVGV